MKKRLWITLAALIVLVLFAGLPLLPTSFLFSFQPLAYDRSRNLSTLAEDDVGKVLTAVRNHDHYGVRGDLPRFLSFYEYFFHYDRIGILSIRHVDDVHRPDDCPSCSIKVWTGFTCGGFCGGGANFYLYVDDGAWKIQTYSLWVS
jgi:hypothetical protein